jgi:hypothetical protein
MMVLVPNEENERKVLRLIELYGNMFKDSVIVVEYPSFSIALLTTSRAVVFSLVQTK